MPLYDILNEFQKGQSHMAVVVKNTKAGTSETLTNVKSSIVEKMIIKKTSKHTQPSLFLFLILVLLSL